VSKTKSRTVKVPAPARLIGAFVQPPVDARDLFHPATARAVFEREQVVVRPVEVEGYVRYLLVEPR
jgi:hypothetical protein